MLATTNEDGATYVASSAVAATVTTNHVWSTGCIGPIARGTADATGPTTSGGRCGGSGSSRSRGRSGNVADGRCFRSRLRYGGSRRRGRGLLDVGNALNLLFRLFDGEDL